MMGLQSAPERLFYDFCLEDHVPDDHLLRRIDAHLELSVVRRKLKPFYSLIGRPSIDAELMIRMLIVGYCFAIRSERRLCEEAHLNLAYRWFCGLRLEGKVPDHSTFSRNRHGRFRDSNILRHVFESMVCRCMAEGLVSGEGFAVDASLIQTASNNARLAPRSHLSKSHVRFAESISMDRGPRRFANRLGCLLFQHVCLSKALPLIRQALFHVKNSKPSNPQAGTGKYCKQADCYRDLTLEFNSVPALDPRDASSDM